MFARHFGVIRLADHGTREVFAPVFQAGLRLPAAGEQPISIPVHYRPVHNIGRLRYLECTAVDAAGKPAEGLRGWSEILFPYDPALTLNQDLAGHPIVMRDTPAVDTVETYLCDPDGIISVQITRGDGQSRTFEVYRA